MKKSITRWQHLGLENTAYSACLDEAAAKNLSFALKIQRLIIVGIGLLAVIYSLVWFHAARFTIVCVYFFLMIGLYWLMAHEQCKDKIKEKNVFLLILCQLEMMLVIAAVFGTVLAEGDPAVYFIWMLLFAQILYDQSSLRNVIITVPATVLFIILSFCTKTPYIASYDLMHAIPSLLLGLYIGMKHSQQSFLNLLNEHKLSQINHALYLAGTTDELTGLPNRRQVFEAFRQAKKDCDNHAAFLCCVILDLDNFKLYNDYYGHPAGDALLKKVGAALNRYAKAEKVSVGRVGGEEFMAVWEDRSPEHAMNVAEELRAMIEELQIPHEKNTANADVATASVGLCMLKGCDTVRMYTLADQALYEAKTTGRNRVCRYDEVMDISVPNL